MSIFLYTQPHCGFCTIMKSMLDEIGKKYYTIDISHSYNARKFLKERGHTTVPQVYLNNYHINKIAFGMKLHNKKNKIKGLVDDTKWYQKKTTRIWIFNIKEMAKSLNMDLNKEDEVNLDIE